MLDVTTVFDAYTKHTSQVKASAIGGSLLLSSAFDEEVSGYEIHMGTTELGKDAKPAFKITQSDGRLVERFDGAVNSTGQVFGTYIHGLFDSLPLRKSFLQALCSMKGVRMELQLNEDIRNVWMASIERVDEAVRQSLDIDKVFQLIGLPRTRELVACS